jgi:hypothetical protein
MGVARNKRRAPGAAGKRMEDLMCFLCLYAERKDAGYFVDYYCKLANNAKSETVDTYFNERKSLIECPRAKLKPSAD